MPPIVPAASPAQVAVSGSSRPSRVRRASPAKTGSASSPATTRASAAPYPFTIVSQSLRHESVTGSAPV